MPRTTPKAERKCNQRGDHGLRTTTGFFAAFSGQMLRTSAAPGRIILEVEPNRRKIIKRGKLKIWSGKVPSTPLREGVPAYSNPKLAVL